VRQVEDRRKVCRPCCASSRTERHRSPLPSQPAHGANVGAPTAGLEYWDTSFSYFDKESGQETFVRVPEMGGASIIAEGGLPPGSIYTIGSDATDNRLAMFLLQTQMNRGSGRIIPLGNLSSNMKEAIKTADAYLKANLKNLGIDHDLEAYDFTVQPSI
jgi:ATP-dependent Lon protease